MDSTRTSRRASALVGAAFLVIALAGTALGTTYVNLTTAGATHTDANGGVWIQGGIGAGTGNFDPFLTLSTNADTEKGVNVCDDAGCPTPQFDTFTGGGRTHELLASAIPQIEYGGALYREFSLDANDSGNDDWMSIDAVEIYLSTNKNLTGYPAGFAGAELIYALPGDADVLMRSQTLSPGSGVSDITLLVPDTVFPDECYYGSQTCTSYVFFYTESGGVGSLGDQNYNVTAGFEEWRVSLQPVVDVAKTVEITYDRTYDWDLAKEANVASIDLFAGDTATIDWAVTVAGGTYTDSNVEVSGEIMVTNPTGPGYAISDPIPAKILAVTDVLELGGANVPLDDLSCPVTFPYTLPAGGTLTCTYSASPSDTDNGTNTATATVEIVAANPQAKPPILQVTQDYSAIEDVDFADALVNEIDECITVTDDNATPADPSDDFTLGEVCVEDLVGGEYTFPTFSTTVGPFDVDTCGSTSVTNTADSATNDTETPDSASDTVDIACYELTVDKTAETSLTRTWLWDVAKSADVETIDLFAGDTAEIDWTVVVTSTGFTDSAWHVQGEITIFNPAPIVAEDVAVGDVISGFAGTITLDCDAVTAGAQTSVDVPAASGGVDGEATCTYAADLPDGTARTNTATATLFEIDYTDTAGVDFTGATVTDVDECIDVTDDNATPLDPSDDLILGEVCLGDLVDDEYTFPSFSTTVGPFDVGECGQTSVTNIASTVTNDTGTTDSATDTVDITCHELTVAKTVVTTFTRDYDWDIAKTRVILPGELDTDGLPGTLTLEVGQTYIANYSVVVTMTGYTDSAWAVNGVITITNPAPIAATGVVVSDVVSPAISPTIDCDPVTPGAQTTVDIAAESFATCTYATPLPDATARTNTATATLFAIDYSSAAEPVAFDDTPDVEIDECIDVSDDAGTPADLTDDIDLGTVCVGDLDGNDQYTFPYTIPIGPYELCGPYVFTNTATFVTTDDENDTDESESAWYVVTVDVPCGGCTLTPGYWKTHNDTFWGGAPSDDTWVLLGDVDGDGLIEGENETFFLSGQTYFEVLWTPKAGNVYYNLAFHYIAAELNMLAGADGSAITTAFADATDLLETYTPAQIAELKGKTGKELRAEFIYLTGILSDYNEGYIGPGHCDEDLTSTAWGVVMPPLLPIRRRLT